MKSGCRLNSLLKYSNSEVSLSMNHLFLLILAGDMGANVSAETFIKSLDTKMHALNQHVLLLFIFIKYC